ncbi:flagellar hook-associated protein FlgL [Desulfovibrio sp. JC022]|uniref:flagellar hook-associated protein FlgL n=1 Tax=Desulfovibrio sp. JC022 TaxID=2593642 RepID=UPI0013D5A017|nr:flagellar hook-associated protein FlgL [Desulfovibrio sp. JC022]NDV23265.1 flagellar hook-associated protein 3 [Desulfovibrio sp. JC022]
MRISTNQIFNMSLYNLNSSMSRMADAQMRNSAQKRVLVPSDDPAAMGGIINCRSFGQETKQYIKNIKTASSWLSLADGVLQQTSTDIGRIKTLAEQAATGTLTAEQRRSIGQNLRGILGNLLNKSNTEFGGKSIFAGHKLDTNAYEQTLSATTTDPNLPGGSVVAVKGASESSVDVRFTSGGTVGTDTITYKYSSDGGKTWKNGTLNPGSTELDLGPATVEMKNGTAVTEHTDKGGTRLIVRPALQYQGDDNDDLNVIKYGDTQVNTEADGKFQSDVLVRIDKNGDVNTPPITYSYSLDNGASWVHSNVSADTRLEVPGGSLTLSPGAGTTMSKGDQFVIRPNTADLRLDISQSRSIRVNNIGKDIFGGIYTKPGAANPTPSPDNKNSNLFETLGRLIGYVETNDKNGIGECVAELKKVHEHVEMKAAEIGARMNRAASAEKLAEIRKDNNTALISRLEDADLGELLSELNQSKLIYEAVARSSRMINQMSILNFM